MSVHAVFARCITRRDYRDLRTVLAPECVMTSMWVLEDMHGAKAICRHFDGKAVAQREKGVYPRGKCGLLIFGDEIEYCVGVFNGKSSPDVIFRITSEKWVIHRIDICDPELFTYTFDEKEMVELMDAQTDR